MIIQATVFTGGIPKKIMIRFVLLMLGLIYGYVTFGQESFLYTKKDLSVDWLVFDNNNFKPVTDYKSIGRTIHFEVSLKVFYGDILSLRSSKEFAIFFNNRFQGNANELQLSVDSLADIYGQELMVSIYSKRGLDDLSTLIQSPVRSDQRLLHETNKKNTEFRDFVIVAFITLALFFIIILKLNARLVLDYLSLRKLISLREGAEDVQSYSRVTSVNILVYIFLSLTMALFIMITSRYCEDYEILNALAASNFTSWLVLWLKVSGIIMIFFLSKIVLTYATSYLFGLGEYAGYYFFSFVRVLTIIFIVFTLIVTVFFISYSQNQLIFQFFFRAIMISLFGWLLLMFFKMTNRTSYSKFHLFSYLCATEIIALIIVTKILYE